VPFLLLLATTDLGGNGVLGLKCFAGKTNGAKETIEGSGLLIFMFLIN
jgi:hypothetical protein